ncbi:uncharacterized protein LOC109791624 [Cajanus cajan]|uniref:uncharacterized protein LOC109791624 n=1 Tax=Cajanus cajan TaxID=3821 RepID=UPI00098D8D43|nr:uncharacterized protein LOC109791624 [Cajanus cajan]
MPPSTIMAHIDVDASADLDPRVDMHDRQPNLVDELFEFQIDLNKVVPKDAYSLPNIDRLVDGASRYAMLNFLDAYSSYNQILMYPPDEENIAFLKEQTNYCYRVMPFRQKCKSYLPKTHG